MLYRLLRRLVSVLPVKVSFMIGGLLGIMAYYILQPYRRLAIRNLTIAFGEEKTPQEIRREARRHFFSLGANLLSSIKVLTLDEKSALSLFEIEDVAIIERQRAKAEGTILAIAHLGNWECLSQLYYLYGRQRQAVIYQRIGNRYIDAHMRKIRAQHHIEPLERKSGIGKAARLLQTGGGVGLLIDQHAGDGGLWTPLFHRLASTSPLAGTLACRTGVRVIFASVQTTGIGRWKLKFKEICPPGQSDPRAITAKLNQALQAAIEASPKDWFWVHNRWKTPKPAFLLEGYKRGVYLQKTQKPGLLVETMPVANPWPSDELLPIAAEPLQDSMLKPFKILIRSSNWLGDAVMSIPSVKAIKNGRPDAHITLLAPEKLADLWRSIPEVDEVIAISANATIFGVARKVKRSAPFDVAILFPNSLRSALEVFLAGVPRRVGYSGHFRKALLNQLVPETAMLQAPEHHAKQFLRIAQHVGSEADEEALSFPSSSKRQLALSMPENSGKLLLGLCPGAEYGPTKRWFPERFAAVANEISKNYDCEWLLFGVAGDAAVGREVEQQLTGSHQNLIGKTSLAELMEHLKHCHLLLSNDTGTMHLAAMLGVPTVSVFGSTEPALTSPLGKHHRVIRHHEPCSPCFLRECPFNLECMNSVTAEKVAEAVGDVLTSHANVIL